MRSLLLDLNVVLDVLLDRKPHVDSAGCRGSPLRVLSPGEAAVLVRKSV